MREEINAGEQATLDRWMTSRMHIYTIIFDYIEYPSLYHMEIYVQVFTYTLTYRIYLHMHDKDWASRAFELSSFFW